MLPSALVLQNYRSFVGPQRLELRPLTLIYGINNTGKSSLLRLLPLIGASLSDNDSGPLHLDHPAMYGASFEDLRWRGQTPERSTDCGDDDDDAAQGIRLGLCWDNDPELQFLDYVFFRFESQQLLRRLLVRSFAAQTRHGRLSARLLLRPDEESQPALSFRVQSTEKEIPTTLKIAFDSLLPRVVTGDSLPELVDICSRLSGMRDRILWLTGQRRSPERYTTIPSNPRWSLKHDGSDAAALLATQPEILRAVSEWYQQMVERRLVLSEVPPAAFRIQLEHIRDPALRVDLLDSGEGMSQVLPILCALELARRRSTEEGPLLLALEEPESHLHPRLQQGLIEHVVNVLRAAPSSRIVLETHSEYLLLVVQREIALGHLQPDQVGIYWLRQLEAGQTVARLSTFDELAFPQGDWPAGVFTEDTEIARELLRARRDKERGL